MKIVNAIMIKNNKIFVVKRKKEPWQGMYGLPGGHVEDGESEIAALIRELKEETGFKIKVIDSIGKESGDFDSTRFDFAFYTAEIIGGKEKFQDDEIEEARWLDIDVFFENLKVHNFPEQGIDSLRRVINNALKLN